MDSASSEYKSLVCFVIYFLRHTSKNFLFDSSNQKKYVVASTSTEKKDFELKLESDYRYIRCWGSLEVQIKAL